MRLHRSRLGDVSSHDSINVADAALRAAPFASAFDDSHNADNIDNDSDNKGDGSDIISINGSIEWT